MSLPAVAYYISPLHGAFHGVDEVEILQENPDNPDYVLVRHPHLPDHFNPSNPNKSREEWIRRENLYIDLAEVQRFVDLEEVKRYLRTL